MCILRTFACIAWSVSTAVVTAAPASQPTKIELKRQPRPGHVTRQRITGTTFGSIRMIEFAPEMKFTQTFEQDIRESCRRVAPDGSATMDMVLERIAMKMSMMGASVEFDSRTYDPAAVPSEEMRMVGKVFSAMAGSRFTVIIGPDGQVQKIEGMNEIRDRVLADLASEKMPASVRKMIDQLGSLFSDENMVQQLKSFDRMIPSKAPVGVGDTWNQTWSMNMPMFHGTIEGTGEYELVGFEELGGRRCAKIRVKKAFRMAAQPLQAAAPAPGAASRPAKGILERMPFEMKSSGGDGMAWWDYESGEMVRLRQTQRMTIVMGLAPDENADESEMKKGVRGITQKLNTSVSVDLLEDGQPVASRPASP